MGDGTRGPRRFSHGGDHCLSHDQADTYLLDSMTGPKVRRPVAQKAPAVHPVTLHLGTRPGKEDWRPCSRRKPPFWQAASRYADFSAPFWQPRSARRVAALRDFIVFRAETSLTMDSYGILWTIWPQPARGLLMWTLPRALAAARPPERQLRGRRPLDGRRSLFENSIAVVPQADGDLLSALEYRL
jgi:hypothetical protein